MPGLVGVVSNNGDGQRLLDRMADSVRHRSWQKTDKFNSPPFHLARVHLGIFNPEPQPTFNQDRTIGVLMYGKIYGYEQEMTELGQRRGFTARNDPEFCLQAYEEYGKDFASRIGLNGSFVAAIFDLNKGHLTIINDRYGLNPLHYVVSNGKLLFASEVKAILQDSSLMKKLDTEAVVQFLALGSVYGNRTFFEGIEVLPPASILSYDGRGVSVEQYWRMEYQPDYQSSEEELADRLVHTFRKAIAVQLDDRLRCSISLSGGYDSRALIAAVDRERRGGLVTHTFGVPGCYDVSIAKATARLAGTKHLYIPVSAEASLGPYPEEIVYLTDGMHGVHGSFAVPAYEQARLHLDVACEGLAAGTTLAGRYMDKAVLKAKDNDELVQILDRRRVFSDYMMAELLHQRFYEDVRDIPMRSIEASLVPEVAHPGNRLDYHIIQDVHRRSLFLGYTALLQNFVETIAPTFDNDFFDVILRIPPELRSQHRIYRTFLKKLDPELARIAYEATMIPADAPLWLWKPALLFQRGKARLARLLFRFSGGRICLPNRHGFAPVDQWLRTNANWRAFTRDTLLSPDACIREFCRQEFIQQLVEEHEAGRAYHFGRINRLLTFELFLRMFVAGTPGQWRPGSHA
jgi:asparagine synthase (glutamine-hydrolysing)